MQDLDNQIQKQTKIYNRLYELGKSFNESIEVDELYEKALEFTTVDLNYEKCLIFENNDDNGWFKVVKSKGYKSPMEQSILKVITLLLGGEVIDYLRLSGKPIVHTQENQDNKVAALLKSLFMKEAYCELFGGDINNPYGLMIVGNSLDEDKQYTSIHNDSMTKLALGNFIMQFSNTINNIIFFKAWEKEKEDLELNISKRTKELETQKKSFEAIYKTSKDGIAILDIQTTAFLDVNQAFADITGYSIDELFKTSCLKLSLNKDIARSKKAMQRVIKDGFITNFIKECKRKNGKTVTINMSVSRMNDDKTVLISAKDITKQKELEEETKKQKDEFEAIYNSAKESIAILDMTSKFLTVNPAYLEMTGFTYDEMLETSCVELSHPDDLEYSKKGLSGLHKKGFIKNFEKRCKIKYDKYIDINMSAVLLRNPDRILINVRDITQEKRVKEIILEEKDKAEEANKSKSQFLANMSHEIRTPMNGIIGMSHLALQTNLNDKQTRYLKNIDTSAKNLLNIINDILDFSKIEAGKLEIDKIDFNMKELLANIENIITVKVDEKDLNFDINYNWSDECICFGDSLRISQVLVNLISNAVKFTDVGKIELIIQRQSDDKVRFIVSDTGIGLTKEQISKLFQSFTQADGSTTRKYGGTGLGLSISKQLVELMNGKIWCESEVGIGSKFIFEIELLKGDINKIIKNQRIDLNQINTLEGSNILLTEDNSTNQEIVKGLLEDSGINIDIANNGQEAVDMFKTNSSKYELILMDLQMPIMGGIEATKIIREINQDIPIIALTANAMKKDVEQTKLAGMQEHLNKPIEIDKLNSTLLKYIYKKVKSPKQTIEQKEYIVLPKFINIDTKVGLYHMNENKELYLKVLNNFKDNYTDCDFDTLNNDEFKRVIHTIKGLSANIGALELNKIVNKLDKTQNKDLLPEFSKELNLVIYELKDLVVDERYNNELLILSDEKKGELFIKLKKALNSKRSKQYKPIIQEIEKYRLDKDYEKVFNKIKLLVKEYKIRDAIKLMM